MVQLAPTCQDLSRRMETGQASSAARTRVWTPPRAAYGAYPVLVWVKCTGAPSWEAPTQTGFLSVTP
jgi:hypothetical protein